MNNENNVSKEEKDDKDDKIVQEKEGMEKVVQKEETQERFKFIREGIINYV